MMMMIIAESALIPRPAHRLPLHNPLCSAPEVLSHSPV